MSRRLGHVRVEMGIKKPILLDAREEPEEGRRVRDVRGIRLSLASTAGEEATNAATAIGDDGARITGGGEDTRLVVEGEDSPLPRGLVSVVIKILADVGEQAGSAAYGDTGSNAVLYDQQARFAVLVEHIWVAREVFRDDVPKLKEAVNRILKARGGVGAGVHLLCEHVGRNFRPWI
jgi:hypothetical protein